MKPNYIYLSAFLLLALPSCTDDSISGEGLPGDGSRKEVRLQASIDQTNVSRADDSGFSDGDRIGIFAVNFTDDTNPGTLMPADNLASNVGFSFDEASNSWEGDRQLYFKDDKTPVDFYGYYPYDYDMAEVEAYPFSVQRNQAAEATGNRLSGYEASDFLWAKSAGVAPATPLVTLTFKHILAGVQVTLVAGEGFEADEWAMLDKSVLVAGTNRDATINLATGETTLAGDGDDKSIIANPYKDDYRAVVIPQSVAAGNTLLSITVDGQSYEFTKEMTMTYLPSKLHKFTILVEKPRPEGDFVFSLLDEAITAWESDLTSHNGNAKEYIIIDIPEAGTLSQVIQESGMNPADIINLKLTGFMNDADFEYIRNSIPDLEAINLSEVELKSFHLTDNHPPLGDNPELILSDNAFCNMTSLKVCVFPKKLVAIGCNAFLGTSLSGPLEIPEGVIFIGHHAFANGMQEGTGSSDVPGFQILTKNNLTETLSLPSTLKEIGDNAFARCDFQGVLLLPEGIEKIGRSAFEGCKHFSGDLHLPESLTTIEEKAFKDMIGITGWITLPEKLTKVNGFSGLKLTGIEWPENALEIGDNAFSGIEINGALKIPESVVSFGYCSFLSAKIKHLILSPNIVSISRSCFEDCSELDSITIPKNVELIENRAFWNCIRLESVELPEKLQQIEDYAFGQCYNLSYIKCNAIEPPQIGGSATFLGVNKDNFTLEVPEQSVEAYRNAPGWSEFRRIAAYRNFVARPSKYNVLNRGGSREIILNADTGWEMTECPSWCHIDKTSGTQKTTLNLTVDPLSRGEQPRFGQITFRLKGDEEYLTHIDVGQYDYEYEEDEYLTLQKATKGNGIDIVIIGDGYDAADISSGLYLDDMKQEIEYFFAVEPYTTYRDYFNVYTALALSDDSGVESINAWRNTKFHVSLGDGCSKDGQRLSADYIAALDYCAENIPPVVNRSNPLICCILVANTDIYEGVCYTGETSCAVVTKSAKNYPYDARGLVQHEAGGHGFGMLGDEYIYYNEFITRCTCKEDHEIMLLQDHTFGYSLNLSLTGKYDNVPWKHLISNPAYSDIVDIFEGGYFHSRGVYRSEGNSCMNNNVPYFSTWSRQLIVQRIMKLAGETFNLDNFYANDSRETGRDFTSTSRSGDINVYTPTRHHNAPVRINNYKFGKKGAKR